MNDHTAKEHKMYRQGDVLLVKAEDVDVSQADKMKSVNGRLVLAEGEATGHSHTLSTDTATGYLFGECMVVVVDEPTELTHQEHDPIAVAPGLYFVVRQREYSPQEIRRVAD